VATQVGIGGTTRDEKTEEEIIMGDTDSVTAMGTAGVQKNCESHSKTLISYWGLESEASCAP
jgi:hypothetical protein